MTLRIQLRAIWRQLYILELDSGYTDSTGRRFLIAEETDIHGKDELQIFHKFRQKV